MYPRKSALLWYYYCVDARDNSLNELATLAVSALNFIQISSLAVALESHYLLDVDTLGEWLLYVRRDVSGVAVVSLKDMA